MSTAELFELTFLLVLFLGLVVPLAVHLYVDLARDLRKLRERPGRDVL